MDSSSNASPNNQAASEMGNNITKMDEKEVKEDTEDPVKEEEKPTEEKPKEEEKAAPESEKEEDKEATENAAAALTSLHESTNAPNEEKGSDKEEEADEEDDDEPRDDSNFSIPLKLTKSGRKRATPFPLKLMRVLSDKAHSDVIAWTESGKAFNILQPKLFTAQILPEFFKTAKYSSFTRKLHRWGFMRHYRGPEAGAFFHKHFRRGRMDLVEKMTCSKPSGTPSSGSKNANRGSASVNDNAPAMSMMMDTSASSRDSGYRGNPNNMMGTLGLPQLQAGPGGFNALMQQQQLNAMGGIPQQFLMQGFGGMPSAAAQQQMLLQQQQLQQQAMAAQQQGGNPSGDTGLDAAIEMEVTRRLKERINAAAFSRQTLMMPQQGAGSTPNQMQQAQGQLQHPNMMQQSMMGGAGRPMFGGGAAMGGASLQGFPPGFKGFDNQAAFMNVQDPYGMPSNIQGAKTA